VAFNFPNGNNHGVAFLKLSDFPEQKIRLVLRRIPAHNFPNGKFNLLWQLSTHQRNLGVRSALPLALTQPRLALAGGVGVRFGVQYCASIGQVHNANLINQKVKIMNFEQSARWND
jgi:hypothetical protein